MKKIRKSSLLTLLLLSAVFVFSQSQDFDMLFQVSENPIGSGQYNVTIATYPGYTYNYNVDWDDDGTFDDTGVTGSITHNYGSSGAHIARVQGTFPVIYQNPRLCDDSSQWFVTEWTTGNETITIPTNSSYTYNYDVDWDNDGIFDDFNITGDITSPSFTAGVHTINIRGTFPAIYFNNQGSKDLISDVKQWGDIQWESFNSSFHGCSNLGYTATDIPDLSFVTDMSNMFNGASTFDGDISKWDVSQITNMNSLFKNASSFNNGSNSEFNSNSNRSGLNAWEVDNVINMESLFSGASSFNRDLNDWEVGNVLYMKNMFNQAIMFNGDISDWVVSNVVTATYMFSNAEEFNGDISGWEFDNVTNMTKMFIRADKFNADISQWDVSNVTNMKQMFHSALAFNQDISGWNVSNVTDMTQMFYGATKFNQDIGGWTVSNVTTMESMFAYAEDFDRSLGGWNLGSVTDIEGMLSNCGMGYNAYDATLIGWNGNMNTPSNLDLGATNLEYCSASAITARANLVSSTGTGKGWTINGDGNSCNTALVANDNSKQEVEKLQFDSFGSTQQSSMENIQIDNLINGDIIIRKNNPKSANETFKIEVLNSNGQLVYSSDQESFNSIINLPLSSQGIYIVKISNSNFAETKNIIIP